MFKLNVPDFEEQNKRWAEYAQKNADDMFDAMQKKEVQATRRFWIPVIISLIALATAGWSLWIQLIQYQSQPKEQSIKVQPFAHPDSVTHSKVSDSLPK